jgi:hypothetical protein
MAGRPETDNDLVSPPGHKAKSPEKCRNPVNLARRDVEPFSQMFQGFFWKIFFLGLDVLKNGKNS